MTYPVAYSSSDDILNHVFDLAGLGEDLPACPTGTWITQACKCPTGTTLVSSGGQAACVADENVTDDGKVDWEKVLAESGVPLVISAICKLTGIGCPPPPPASGYPAGFVQPAAPWYATTGGAVAITLGVVGLFVGGYLLVKNDKD